MPARRLLQGLAAAGACALAGMVAATASPALEAPPSAFDPQGALAYSQSAIGRSISPHRLLDGTSNGRHLAEFGGKPLVLNLVYTGCTHSCPLIVQTLYQAVETAQDTFGPEAFTIVTIGFDTDMDTPEQMRAYARSQGVDLPGWHFFSADKATVDRLSGEVGFIYFPSPKGFDHLAQVTVLDAEGRVYRQVYGDAFEPPALVEPLKQLIYGRPSEPLSIEGIVDRVRLFCTLYDPASGRYRFEWSLFVGLVIGAASLIGVGTILVRALLRDLRRQRL
ncbi:MAG: SCO family protein [Inquilinus sp.]|nr:SCO family protein [Inquilinus sp.]